jgi:hypothetical protein
MAIFWTVLAVVAVVQISRMGLSTPEIIVLIFLAFVTIAGNWLRYFRTK